MQQTEGNVATRVIKDDNLAWGLAMKMVLMLGYKEQREDDNECFKSKNGTDRTSDHGSYTKEQAWQMLYLMNRQMLYLMYRQIRCYILCTGRCYIYHGLYSMY